MQPRNDRIKSLAAMSRFRVGPLLVQPDQLLIIHDGSEIALEPRMMEVLVALAEHAGEVISAEQLLIEVWRGSFYGDNPVHKAIAHLRRLVGDDSRAPRFIETIRKRGYRLIAKVSFPDDYRRAAIQTSAWSGRSPYVGLSAFDGDHASVFFGRSRLSAELLAAMRRQIDNQGRFVLIVGASGCGKTSLLHAGVIPLLQQDGGFDGTRALAVACCDLAGAHGGDVLAHLAAALMQWRHGDRPVFAAQPPADLARALVERPAMLAEAIDQAILRHPIRDLAETPRAHFLLVIDHAEALVAEPSIRRDERRDFERVLGALCESPRALVTMITRSDFYPALIEAVPELAERKGGDGHVDVLTPRPGEIAQIIRGPALLAGLSFEEDAHTQSRLDDVLRDAAGTHLDALPLLQHTLQSLYEQRDEAGELGFGAYRAIGGLEGALTHRAENVFATLPPNAQQSLEAVLSRLIVIQADSESISARRVATSALPDEGARILVEAFIRARLFIGELSDGRPAFGVVHESLLRQWPRVREWAQDNRRLLQARARLQRAARRWAEEGCRNDHLLNPGRPLSEALEAAQRLPDELSADERALLGASEHQQQRRRWLKIGATVSLAMLAIVASGLAVFAQRARTEAEQRREEALRLNEFMLGDLADKLRPLGNLALLDSISGAALASLDRQPDGQLQTADLINRSRALRTLGEVLMEQAKFDAALTAFSGADGAARAAVERAPQSESALAEFGVAAYWLGNYHYRRNAFSEAEKHMLAYLDSSQRLVRINPQNPTWLVEESYAYDNLGAVARDLGQIDASIAHFRRSAALKQRVVEIRPDDENLRFDLIDTLSSVSRGDESTGRLQEAATGYAEQIGMLRQLLDANPGARRWERRLATSLIRSATLAMMRGGLDDAAALIEESVERLSRLTEQEPDNRFWVRDLADAHIKAAEIARMRGQRERAGAHVGLAATLAERMSDEVSPPLPWRRLDAIIRIQFAQLAATTAASAQEVADALTELEYVASHAGGDVVEISAIANFLIARSLQLVDAGNRTGAQSDCQRVIGLLRDIAPDSNEPNVLAAWVSAHALLGERNRIEPQFDWLKQIGYRHPDFIRATDGSMSATVLALDTGARPD